MACGAAAALRCAVVVKERSHELARLVSAVSAWLRSCLLLVASVLQHASWLIVRARPKLNCCGLLWPQKSLRGWSQPNSSLQIERAHSKLHNFE